MPPEDAININLASTINRGLAQIQSFRGIIINITQEVKEQNATLEKTIKNYKDMAELAKTVGDSTAYYAGQIKALDEQFKSTKDEDFRELINKQINRLRAREKGDIGGLIKTGFSDKTFKVNEEFVKFWEEKIPNAFTTASDAFGKFVTDTMFGATSIGDAWKSLGITVQAAVQKMITDFVSLQMQMLIFGSGGSGGSSGSGGFLGLLGDLLGGLLGDSGGTSTPFWNNPGISLFPGGLPTLASGGVFNGAAGLSAYSGSIVASPTIFPFARGIGLMGEAGPEAIMPLKRTAQGKLGVEAAGLGSAPVNIEFNVINNAGDKVGVEAKRTPTANGGVRLDVMVNNLVRQEMARGGFDATMRGAYNLSRPPVRTA